MKILLLYSLHLDQTFLFKRIIKKFKTFQEKKLERCYIKILKIVY